MVDLDLQGYDYCYTHQNNHLCHVSGSFFEGPMVGGLLLQAYSEVTSDQFTLVVLLYIQGGPLPVINGVITPLIGVASPHLPIYFRPFRGAP